MFSLIHIDPNLFYKDILHTIAFEKGFKYYSAKTIEQAVEIIQTYEIDVIITSLEFDDRSEEHLVETLVNVKSASTPIIVLTALDDLDLKKRLFEKGISDFIMKSYFNEYILELIDRLEYNDLILSKIKKLSIAMVDDNYTHLLIMRDILYNNDIHHIDLYSHPQDLLDSKKLYDIYFVDCIMPGLTGDQLIGKLRVKDEYAVIIAMSTLSNLSVATSALLQGANDFISKPFTDKELIARLKSNVRTYSLMKDLKDKNSLLERLAREDGLTGLLNHKAIMDHLRSEIDRAKRYKTPLSLLMFDIDRFKNVNDQYGHHIGDAVLSGIGAMWTHESRCSDYAGRYGGEEFIVILPNTDVVDARLYAERLRKDIESMTFSNKNVKITISGGVVQYHGESPEELIQLVDKHLYAAKNSGRNRIYS